VNICSGEKQETGGKLNQSRYCAKQIIYCHWKSLLPSCNKLDDQACGGQTWVL